MSESNYSENEREGATAPSSASSGADAEDDRPSVEDGWCRLGIQGGDGGSTFSGDL